MEEILEKRYRGRLWQEETVAGKLDPRLKRTEESLSKLTELRNDIEAFIAQIHKEFAAASGQGDSHKE